MNATDMHLKLLQANFTTKCLGTSRKDDDLTHEAIERHNLQEDAVRVTKNLMKAQLAPIRQNIGHARRFHLWRTFCGIGDARILTVAEQEQYNHGMGEYHKIHTELVQDFIDKYEGPHMDLEKTKHAKTFNPEDYPSKGDLPGYFGFEFSIIPMPDPNSFLKMKLAGPMAEQLKKQYEASLAATTTQIAHSVQSEVLRLIGEVAETLSNPDAPLVDTENRKGAIGKLREYLDRIPSINITNDPIINNIAEEAKKKLDLCVDTLRTSKIHRKTQAAMARAMAEKFGAFGSGRKIAA